MLRRYVDLVMNPAWYHGHDRRGPFFEGWYYKLIDATENHRYAIIPGIFRGQDQHKDHAFVQVLDGMTGRATYHSYPVAAFEAARDRFEVCVGPNRFSADQIELHIDDETLALHGDLHFTGLHPWPVTLTSPGIMGWYGWLPFMECYHGVVSLDHALAGAVSVDGDRVDFAGGRGYIEKDWGQSFPSAYIWLQTNHFDQPGTSLTGSVAIIPWRSQAFNGFIVGLWHEGQLYRFATYTGARVEQVRLSDEHVQWVLCDGRYRLEMSAVRKSGGLLKAPIRTEMHKRVDETMQSSVDMRLTEIASGRVILESTGRNAALEVHGEVEKLLTS